MVDASALAAFILKEPGWERLARYIKQSVSVDMVAKEVANTIWKAHIRGLVAADVAERLFYILSSLLEKNVRLEPESAYLPDAFRIAVAHRITVYDALYLAVAQKRGAALLTLDAQQREAAKRLGVDVVTP